MKLRVQIPLAVKKMAEKLWLRLIFSETL